MRYEAEGLLWDLGLRNLVNPVSMYMHDIQHCVFTSGVFNSLVYVFLETLWLGKVKNVYVAMRQMLDGVHWPASMGWDRGLQDVFSDSRVTAWRAAKHVKCSAGAAMALYPLVVYFAQSVISPDWPNQVNCLVRFANLADLLCDLAYGQVTEALLRVAVNDFLESCVAAGWRLFMHPKYHWLIHIPREYGRRNFSMTCFALERKHKQPKAYAVQHKNLTSYSKSLLAETTCESITDVTEVGAFRVDVGLINPRVASHKNAKVIGRLLGISGRDLQDIDVYTALKARSSFRCVTAQGDLALIRTPDSMEVAEICIHVRADGILYSVVSVFVRLEAFCTRTHTSYWRKQRSLTLVPMEDVLAPCVAKRYDDDTFTVFTPFHLR